MKYIYASLIVFVLIGLFFLFYILNKKTKKPKDCENLIDESKCLNCHSPFCRISQKKEKGDDK